MAGVRSSRVLVVLAVLFGWLLAFAPAAQAHAVLEATNPVNGQHLATAPSEVTMTFSERVNLITNGIQVLDRSGQRRNQAKPTVNGATVRIPLDSGIGDGVYTVNWRVVSADSHPINGAFVFSVGNATAAPLTGPTEKSGALAAVTDVFWLFRWVAYAGLALLVGGAFFRVVCWPAGRRDPRARRIVRAGWLASLVGAVGSFFLQGPNSAGSSIAKVVDPSLLNDTVRTDFGVAMLVRIGLLGVIAVLLPWLFPASRTAPAGASTRDDPADAAGDRISPVRLGVLAVVGVAFVATWAWTGHAHVGDQAPLAVVADVAHLSAMSIWMGGLVLLTACVLPHNRAVLAEAAQALPRFSTTAMAAVAVLVTTGVYAAWREVRTFSALAGTQYGKLLIFKLAAFGVLMALAAMSRSTVQRRYVVPVVRAAAAQAPPPKGGGGSSPGSSGSARTGRTGQPGGAGKKSGRSGGSGRAHKPAAQKPTSQKPTSQKPGRTARSTPAHAAAPAAEPKVSRRVQREQEQTERAALGALRQSVRLEAGVVVGVLALTAVLVATPPGQVAGAFEAAPTTAPSTPTLPFSRKVSLGDGAGAVQVSLTPARSGDNTLVLAVQDSNGTNHDVLGVTAEFSLPANKLGPLPVTLVHQGVGQYTGRSITLPVAGTWKLTLKVRTSEFDETSVSVSVPVH